jgi:hypothetical protein
MAMTILQAALTFFADKMWILLTVLTIQRNRAG